MCKRKKNRNIILIGVFPPQTNPRHQSASHGDVRWCHQRSRINLRANYSNYEPTWWTIVHLWMQRLCAIVVFWFGIIKIAKERSGAEAGCEPKQVKHGCVLKASRISPFQSCMIVPNFVELTSGNSKSFNFKWGCSSGKFAWNLWRKSLTNSKIKL